MNTRTEKQQRSIERLIWSLIAAVILCGLITPLVITYCIFPAQLERLIEPPAVTVTASPLPDELKDWTPEQLEDEQTNYLEAITTLKDEQHRREKASEYKPEEWEVVTEPVDL